MTGLNNNKKITVFTYRDPTVRMITKLFRNTELKIEYKTMNTLRNHPETNKKKTNKYELCGVYWLKCGDCPHIYIGQTGWPFKTQYNEHIRGIKNNGENSKFALHIQNTGHRCTSIEETLDTLHVQRKGRMMNTLESFRIYEAYKQGIQLNIIILYTILLSKARQTKVPSQPITKSNPTFRTTHYPLKSDPILAPPFKFWSC
jgi:hypothetical protein